ncbi:MAG TPA: LysR family transcriptional regulator [Candidatus Polarisedimenticolaceae bacterium]|nr:LysR family transcriptional regulator [Candidatus Polarisedimenticolaceae bacterium]
MADPAALETFVAIARHGSVLRAAERLNRTQPSLSARLAALEASWKTKLFRRHARGMTLTPEGARLLAIAESALAGLAEVDRAAGVATAGASELRVGSGDALGRERLPRALTALRRERPGIEVRVLEGPTSRLLEALRAGEVDVALITGRPEGVPGIDVADLASSAVDLFIRRGGTFPRPATLESLSSEPMVALQPGSGFRRHLEAAFTSKGLPFRPAIEVGNLALVRRFVAAGLGLALVPAIAFPGAEGAAGIARREIRGIPPISYSIASRAGIPTSELSRRFIEIVKGI